MRDDRICDGGKPTYDAGGGVATDPVIRQLQAGRVPGVIRRLKDPDLIFGCLAFHFRWREDLQAIQAADQIGCVPTRAEFEELVSAWRAFYDEVPDVEIAAHNDACWDNAYGGDAFRHRGRNPKIIPGFVYVMSVSDGRHKIGASVDPEKRAKSLRQTFGQTYTVIHQIAAADMFGAELEIFNRLWRCWIEGEYFRLGEAQLDWLKSLSKWPETGD
jgi:hypothetical protein